MGGFWGVIDIYLFNFSFGHAKSALAFIIILLVQEVSVCLTSYLCKLIVIVQTVGIGEVV